MKTVLEKSIQQAISTLIEENFLPADINFTIKIDRTRDKKHGDFASNIAMVLAKLAKCSPMEVAEKLISAMPKIENLAKMEVVKPGFINFFVQENIKADIIKIILERGKEFGRNNLGQGKKIIIEFVSANPTGPLHVGHGRGAAFGAVISDLLSAVGYDIHREYYVNDAGRQMDILAVSIWLRYLELSHEVFTFPINAYQGEYIRDIAKILLKNNANQFFYSAKAIFEDIIIEDKVDKEAYKEVYIDKLIAKAKNLLGERYEIIHAFGTEKILADIKQDLEEFGVYFDAWFSEKSLVKSGAIEKSINALEQRNYLYEQDGALWFRSSVLGDEKDRVLIRNNGQHTYFASDIAYQFNKINRGFLRMINVFGADHHGYVPRLRAAITALGFDASALQIPLVQFAVLYKNKKRLQMSTRSGEFITLRELRSDVGNEATRFFYIMRKIDQHLDFDLDLAVSQSQDNPLYYIQYAHARICSVFRELVKKELTRDKLMGLAFLSELENSHEQQLISRLNYYPELIVQAAEKLEPHLLTHYLRELAQDFHTYYNASAFLVENESLRNARLCLIDAVRQVLQNGLALLGLTAPEKM